MKVVFVLGQTASGKSALAQQLAKKYQGVIINMDSIQAYHGLEIGSAAPSKQDQAQVPHFLFSYVEPPKELTAADFRQDFLTCLKNLEDRYKVVFAVGGTGFYLRAIEHGMFAVGARDENLVRELEEIYARESGPEQLWLELQAQDPVAAKRIFPNDQYRLVRAIELIRSRGKTPSQLQIEKTREPSQFPYEKAKIGILLEKEELRKRVILRTKKMLAEGFIDEVQGLLDRGLQDWAPLSSVGYKQVVAYLQARGGNSLHEMQALENEIVLRTMQLAKKQKTWFQKDAEIEWLKPGQAWEVSW